MFTIIAIAIISLTAALYYKVWKRLDGRPVLRTAASIAIALPLAILFAAICTLRLSNDNSPCIMHLLSGAMTVAMTLLVSQTAFYCFIAPSRRKVFVAAGAAAALCVTAAAVWGVAFGRKNITVNRIEINAGSRLPRSFDALRIVQFSDLHIGSLLDREAEIRAAVDTINALDADIVVFCGDLVNIRCDELDDAAMAVLGGISAREGVFSVMGNHDTGVYIRDSIALPADTNRRRIIERQRAMGWRVLQDETVYLRRGGDSIAVTGIDFRREYQEVRHAASIPAMEVASVYEPLPRDIYDITLVHMPQAWDKILETAHGDLTLAGHVHSMQMKLHAGARGISPARLLYRRWSGLYTERGRHLYINDGIGYVGFPMRLGAYPEITLFEIRTE